MSLGRYLEGAGVSGNYANTNPTLRMPQTTTAFGTAGVTRAWIDANRNFVPDCDLLNPAAQDLRAERRRSLRRDVEHELRQERPHQQLRRRTSSRDGASVRRIGIWRCRSSSRWERGRRWTSTYTQALVSRVLRGRQPRAPAVRSDAVQHRGPGGPRLPGGGGYVVSGLYDVVPEKAGQVDNLIADSRGYGAWSQYFNGIDVTASIRGGQRFMLTGGTSTGQTVADSCGVRAHLPELATTDDRDECVRRRPGRHRP